MVEIKLTLKQAETTEQALAIYIETLESYLRESPYSEIVDVRRRTAKQALDEIRRAWGNK